MHLRARFSIIFVAMAALAFASAVKADPIYTSSTAFSSATYGVSSVGFSSPAMVLIPARVRATRSGR